MNRLGEALRRLPAPVSYGIVCIVLVGAAVAIVMQLRPATSVTQQDAGRIIYCKCSQCGHVVEGSAMELADKGILDPVEKSTLTDSGKRCPQCGRNALDVAFKCPKDGEVFLLKRQAGRTLGCPKCGWNPYAR
ncbi:MAG: hypothetical protein ACUVXJ_17245 [Phycisphaerae bacterium]